MSYLTDSHFHSLGISDVDFKDVYSSVKLGIDVATKVEDTDLIYNRLSGFDNIFTTISAGPWEASNDKEVNKKISQSLEKLVLKYAEKNKIVAIGEIGLDYFHSDYADKDMQEDLFALELTLAKKYSYPVILHIRDSFEDTYDIIKRYNIEKRGIVHCFSGKVNDLKNFLDLGFYISFSGNITYKRNENIRKCASIVPFDSLLIETDSPYLSPQQKRGSANTPENTRYVAECISQLRGKEKEYIEYISYENLKKFVEQKVVLQ